MMHQCSVFTTKAQYDRSIILLENILSLDSTRDALGLHCVDAIQGLMNKLVGKERHLAYHIRRHATMSLDAMTTSAVESWILLQKRNWDWTVIWICRATGMAEEHDDHYICPQTELHDLGQKIDHLLRILSEILIIYNWVLIIYNRVFFIYKKYKKVPNCAPFFCFPPFLYIIRPRLSSSLGNRSIAASYRYRSWQL